MNNVETEERGRVSIKSWARQMWDIPVSEARPPRKALGSVAMAA